MLRLLLQESYFENHFISTIPHEQWYSNFAVCVKANLKKKTKYRGPIFVI